MSNVSKKTKDIAKLGVLAAISVLLVLVHFSPVPSVPFLEYDPADVPILLATFAMGPAAGLLLTVVTALIQGVTVSAASGLYGIIMHIVATGTYVAVAGSIYKHHKTKKMAVLSLICGVIAWVLVMIPANLFITPVYMGVPREAVSAMLWTGIVPFNLFKSGLNSVITFVLYKRVSGILHK